MLRYLKHTTSSSSSSSNIGSGFVFITNIEAIGGNVSDKIQVPNTIPTNTVLSECTVDKNTIRVHFIAEGGKDYSPTVSINGINCTNLQQYANDVRLFYGYIDIVLLNTSVISVLSNTGQKAECLINIDSPPTISFIEFVGSYPNAQTELKSGDTFNLRVVTDKNINRIEILNIGACIAQNFDVSDGTDHTISVTIANTGIVAQLLTATAKVRTSSGSYSDEFVTTNTVNCNNLKPTVSIGTITYPINQQALKDNEVAIVANTVTNFDTITYTSPNNDLSIADSTVYDNMKQVNRVGGNYNITTTNFRITATRAANNSSTTSNKIVQIANVDPILTVSEQYTRLRSSNVGSLYVITLTSNQKLIEAPSLNIPHGTFTGTFTTANSLIQTRNIIVSDTDLKGIHNYNGLVATNLAGKVVNVISGDTTYELGGFITRRLTFPAFSRINNIGTNVVLVGSVQVVDVGGYTFTYSPDKSNETLKFTVTDSFGNLDSTGDHIYICDDNQVNQNSTGTAQIDIQEVI